MDTRIVGFCVSGVHGEENLFELLIAYADGVELGVILSREILQDLKEQLEQYL